jgi:acetylornithine deacetylase/succinyl-diaminopimelate desuccinylase-like protein
MQYHPFMRNYLAATALLLTALTLHAQRPEPRLTISEAFDPGAVPAYGGNHAKVYAHIDAHQAEHLAALQRWLRQPSISAQNTGIAEMAEMLRGDLEALGFKETAIVPTAGHPGVFGFYDAGAAKTLVVYLMYDVQPVVPEDWRVKPFDGALVDTKDGKVLMARGAANQKGPERGFFNALQSIIAVDGTLPINLLVLAEGEEELSSPHMPDLVAKYEARIKASHPIGVFFPIANQDAGGAVTMFLGVKGLLYFELEAKGTERGGPMRSEVHGSYKALIDSPVLRLTQAIASMTTIDGNTIVVDHYYDAVRQPNDEEQRLYNAMLPAWTARESALREALGVKRWIANWGGAQSLLHQLQDTTLNVDGIWGGYEGPGPKTILPHKATAKMDSRLVPEQTPEESLRLIRAHLDKHGFDDIEIHPIGGYPPAQSSVDAPLIRAGIGVYNKYKLAPAVAPRLAGSAPYYLFTKRLGLPMLAGGIGYGAAQHAPNEFLVIEPKGGSTVAGLAQQEKFYADLVYAFAGVK